MTLRVFLFSLMISFALPQITLASQCSSLFEPHGLDALDKSLKVDILKGALLDTKIRLTKDEKYIQSVFKKWKLEESSPEKIEAIAQKLVIKKDSEPAFESFKGFLHWTRTLFFKPDPVKELVRVRSETLLLKDELLSRLEVYGYKKENSKYEQLKHYKNSHYNKFQLVKLVAFNAAFYGALKLTLAHYGIHIDIPFYYPVYMPAFDFIRSLDLTEAELTLVKTKGFELAYPTIKERHRMSIGTTQGLYRMPKVVFFGLIGYLGYNYFSYHTEDAKFKDINVEEIIPKTSSLYVSWEKSFIEKNGRKPDMKNAQDRKEWDNAVLPVYMGWSEYFNERNGRYPDLSKKEDLKAWQEFLQGTKSDSSESQEQPSR